MIHVGHEHQFQSVSARCQIGEEQLRLIHLVEHVGLQHPAPRLHRVVQMVEVHHIQAVQQPVFLMPPFSDAMIHALRIHPLVLNDIAEREYPRRQILFLCIVVFLGGLGLYLLPRSCQLFKQTMMSPANPVCFSHNRIIKHRLEVLRRNRFTWRTKHFLNTYSHNFIYKR